MAYIDKLSINGINRDLRDTGAVRTDEAQALSDAQKATALENIGAASVKDIDELKSVLNEIGAVNPKWEQGGIGYSNGNPYDSFNRSRTSDYINFGASVDFVVTIPADHQLTVYYYDSSETFISYVSGLTTVYYGTTTATTQYVKFQVSKDDTSSAVPAKYGEDCKIYLVSKSLMRAFNEFGFKWLQLTSARASDYSTLANLPINTITYTSLSWISSDDLPQGSGYYYILTIGRPIIEYNAIQLAIDPYAAAQVIYIRNRTTVSGGYSRWQRIGTQVLNSTNDTTDRASEIQAMLDTFGVCHLGVGDFYVSSTISLPTYGKLYGEGNKTRIIRTGDTGSAVRMYSYSSISDLYIRGSATDITPTVENQGKHGILWLGTFDSTTRIDGPYCGMISNVTITDCKGCGIFTWKSGREPSTGLNVSNVIINRCGIGVSADDNSEFSQWLNLKVTSCGIGVRCTGGNQIFANCNFSSNIQALDMEGTSASENNSHGSFSNCVFDHSGGNTGYAMKIKGMVNGEIFTGCQIFYGKIRIENCAGIRFIGANFGRQTGITIINSTAVIFSDCQMRESSDTPVTPPTGGTSVMFKECYCRDGSEFVVQ